MEPIFLAVALFNGSSLSGWHMDVPALDGDPQGAKPFVVRDGKLVSLGRPGGHLITDNSYSDYRLRVEYRFTGQAGNCGVLIHASKPRRLYDMFPQSLEVQLQSGDAGDFWCIGEDIWTPNMEMRRGPKNAWGVDGEKRRRIENLTNDSENALGQWNSMVIDCRGRDVMVWVNDHLVNHGSRCTAKSGQIAIQAEGVEVEFRRIELTRYSSGISL